MPILFKKQRQYKVLDLIPLKDTLGELPQVIDHDAIIVIEHQKQKYILRGLEHVVKAYELGLKVIRTEFHSYTPASAKKIINKKIGNFTSVADFTIEKAAILTPPDYILGKEIEVEVPVEVEVEVPVEVEVELDSGPLMELGGSTIAECMRIAAASGDFTSEECYQACRLYFEEQDNA